MRYSSSARTSETTEAIVLKVREVREADVVVWFLGEGGSLSRGLAINARKSSRRFLNCLEPLSLVTFSLVRYPSRIVLKEGRLQEAFLHLKEDHLLLGFGNVVSETIVRCMPEDDPHAARFPLAVEALQWLSAGRLDPMLITTIFLVRFMTVEGYCPSFDRCAICGSLLGAQERWVWQLAPLRCVCATHHLTGSLKWEWDREVLRFLQSVRLMHLEKTWHLGLSSSKRQPLFMSLCRWVETIIGGELKSYRWLQKMAMSQRR